MALENKLVQLQQLEVGNVEKAIEDIERTKLSHSDVSQAYDQELRAYADMLEEKMPRLIENIYLLRDQIRGLREHVYSFHPIEVNGDKTRVQIHKLSDKGCFGIVAEYFLNSCLGFSFNDDGSSRKTFFSIYQWSRNSRKEYVPDFIGNNILEFSHKMNAFLVEYQRNPDSARRGLYNGLNDCYENIPYLLNMVPSLISEIYLGEKQKHEERLNGLQSQSQNLKSLQVSDII